MIDTVRASTEMRQGQIDTRIFPVKSTQASQQTGEMGVRYIRNPEPGHVEPRLTYYPDPPKGPRLVVEVSLPKLLYGDRPVLLSSGEVSSAIGGVKAWLYNLGLSVPYLEDWKATRLDYYWQWEVDNMDEYMATIATLQLSRYAKTVYGKAGVSWRNDGKRVHRRIKFYDKEKELGQRKGKLLRFEVSQHAQALRDLATRVENVPLIVSALVDEQLVKRRLARWLDALGLCATSYGSTVTLRSRISAVLGVSAIANAEYFIDVYHTHGTQAISLGHITKNKYYYWLKLLKDNDLLTVSDVSLDPLVVA